MFTVQVLLIILLGGLYLDWQLRQTLEDELAEKLAHLARTAALQLDADLLALISPGDEATRTFATIRAQLRALQSASSARRMFVFTRDRASLADTRPQMPIGADYAFLPITSSELDSLFSGKTVNSPLFEGSDEKLYKTAFAPIFQNREVIAGLALEGSAQSLNAIRTVRRDLFLLGIVVLVGSILLAIFVSKRITIPINKLKTAAERITHGDYDTGVKVRTRDEIGFLARTMEEMRRAIVQRDTRQKAMLAGVAHEIRNPLGGIELFAGLLASELTEAKAKNEADKILKEVQNLKRIVSDFLDYARPQTPRRQKCLIHEVIAECQMLLAGELQNVKVEVSEQVQKKAVLVDPQHLKRILINLMKNSVESMAGSGTIRIDAVNAGGFTELILSDSGPGIPPDLRARVFEPFFTSRKDGTGLGLAIVKTLVEENKGDIYISDGNGAVFNIRLASC